MPKKKSCSFAILLTCPERVSLSLSGNFALSCFFLAMAFNRTSFTFFLYQKISLCDIIIISMQEKLLNDEFLIDK